jgi:hypothetical protein
MELADRRSLKSRLWPNWSALGERVAALRADLDAQRAKTQTDLDKLSVYPVVSIGLALHL